jgi:hypothetical protein
VDVGDTTIGVGFVRDALGGSRFSFATGNGCFVSAGVALGGRMCLRFAGLFFFILSASASYRVSRELDVEFAAFR